MSAENGKKPKPQKAKLLEGLKFAGPSDSKARKELPMLFDLLCPRWQENVLVREPGRMSIKIDGGGYTVNIECPTEGWQTTLTVVGLADLLATVEAILGEGKANWTETWQKKKKARQLLDQQV